MVDDVWPLAPGTRVALRSFNGIGFGFKSFTRTDASGGCFATRWFTVLYMPVIPLERYYVTEGASSGTNLGFYSETRTRYQIHGRSRLHAGEILRTYLYQWLLAPGFVIVPTALWLGHANEISGETTDDVTPWRFGLLIGVFVVWLLGSIVVLVLLSLRYRQRWAPLREVRRVSARAGRTWAAGWPSGRRH